jgi:hypothetical protein
MKPILCKWYLTGILFLAVLSSLTAQPVTDSGLDKKLQPLVNGIKKTDSLIMNMSGKADKATHASDSIANKDSASFFNAWKYAVKHPETLYAKACAKCERNWVITILVFIFLLYFLYKSFFYFSNSALCRDESFFTDPKDGVTKMRPVKERPYSYSRTQMFWWTIIIISCYGYFYAIYGTLLPLDPTCILLLGMGISVQIFGKTIDNSQKANDRDKTSDSNLLPKRHQDLNPSQGLLTDILSDENGISMHRLQSVAFNIIYGFGFIGYFMTSILSAAYPLIELDGWQLALLGISAGGYLGLKTTENSKASEADRTRQAEDLKEKALTENAKLNMTAVLPADQKNTDAEPISVARNENNYQ